MSLLSTRSQNGPVTCLHIARISSGMYRLVLDILTGRGDQLWQSSMTNTKLCHAGNHDVSRPLF
jgi:hypothetical protein